MEPSYDAVDAQREIDDERFEYQENQQRSDEEGWFYSDENE